MINKLSSQKLIIKELAKEQGLTLAQVAKRAGMTASALTMAMNRNVSLSILQKIADGLGVRVSDLFEQPDFIALIRHNRQTYSFDTPEQLKEFVKENFKED